MRENKIENNMTSTNLDLGELAFRAADFQTPYPVIVSVEMSREETMAAIANQILRDKLAKAPVLNGPRKTPYGRIGWYIEGIGRTHHFTHRARLILIEKLEGE